MKCTVYSSFRTSTSTSRWFPVKWHHLRVTSSHLRSLDVISCHVTASSSKLQPSRKSNLQYTRVFGLLQPLAGDFRSNDVTSGSLPVTCNHVTSFLVTWLPPHANYSLVGSETYGMHEISAFYCHFRWLPVKWRHFRVTSCHLKSHDVIFCRVTASSCELQLVESEIYSTRQLSAFHSRFQVTSGQMKSLPGHFQTPEFTWRHFASRDYLLPATAL